MITCEVSKTISNKTRHNRSILSTTVEQFQHLILSRHTVEIVNSFKYLGTNIVFVDFLSFTEFASNPNVYSK